MRKTILLWTLLVTIFGFFAATATAQDSNNTITHQVQPGEHLLSLSLQHNVCIDAIKAANPDLIFGGQYDPLPNAEIEIPTDAPECYERYIAQEGDTGLEISLKFNICPEILKPLNNSDGLVTTHWDNLQAPLNKGKIINIPTDALPCYNDKGQRLYYEYILQDGEWRLDSGEYTDMQVYTSPFPTSYGNLTIFAKQLSICPKDLIWINLLQIFIKENARNCDFDSLDGDVIETLYDISLKHNVCIEKIIEVQEFYIDTWDPFRSFALAVPQNVPPCYDYTGNRLNQDDKAVHETQPGEFLVDIAEQYNVCVADLIAANPFINANQIRPPKVLFIPNTSPCHRPYHHKLAEGENFTTVSQHFNVCINRIADANPWTTHITHIKPGDTVIIPDRPPCYEMIYGDGDYYAGYKMREYVCYAQAIDFETDYSGHNPVISPVALDVKDNFCYERGTWSTTVIYENEPITAYRIRPYDTMSQVAACFNIDVNDLVALNNQEYTYEVRPYGYWVLPPDYDRNCPLLTMTKEEYKQYKNDLSNRAGYISEGVYVVNHQDTLSSIGKEFGYLPEWIAAENGLENPDMIFYLQELKLPSHPNYWQLATIGGGVLATVSISSALSLLLRWRRRKPKRKNITAEKF